MAKDKKPIEEIPEEENVITPEEFQQLESKEQKKKLGGSFFSKKAADKPQSEKRGPERTDSDNVLVSVEKIQAKLETMEGLRQATEEKISRISEEIGELRSAILEKEKTFNQVESGFEKVKDIFQELQPKKIRDDLDRKEDAIEKLTAKVESFDTRIGELKNNMSEVLGIMDNIKDIKNVIGISANISRKMAKIDDDKKDMAKTAGKVESLFSEITEKMTEFHDYKEKIEFSSESMHDMMKSMDMLEVKVDNALTKDDMKKIDDKLEQMEADLSDKTRLVRDIVDDLVTSLKKGGVKDLLKEAGKTRIDEINKKFSEIEGYEKGLKETREELAKLREEKSKDMAAVVAELDNLKQSQALAQAQLVAQSLMNAPVSQSQTSQEKPGKKGKKVPVAEAEQPGLTLNPLSDMQPDYASQDYPSQGYAQPGPSEGVPQEGIEPLMEECHRCIDSGDVESAKSLYIKILDMYEQTKDTPEGEQLYGKIKRLYYRLQIYA